MNIAAKPNEVNGIKVSRRTLKSGKECGKFTRSFVKKLNGGRNGKEIYRKDKKRKCTPG